ncbi:MAG TPA: hypothetical protein VMO24_08110 [Woeseiaceae bacterium]|nr:hypothetical protein [Woeseiaceae bacterium]
MEKRNSAAAAILLAASLTCGAQPRVSSDGCAALAEQVRSSVSAAVREYRRQEPARLGTLSQRRDLIEVTGGGQHLCGDTAAVASKAFVQALHGFDFRISWNRDWIAPGDYCLSHDLRQCYPSGDPFSPLPPHRDFAFVNKAWLGVTEALAAQMPYGTAGDLVNFSDGSFATALTTQWSPALRPVTHATTTSEPMTRVQDGT